MQAAYDCKKRRGADDTKPHHGEPCWRKRPAYKAKSSQMFGCSMA